MPHKLTEINLPLLRRRPRRVPRRPVLLRLLLLTKKAKKPKKAKKLQRRRPRSHSPMTAKVVLPMWSLLKMPRLGGRLLCWHWDWSPSLSHHSPTPTLRGRMWKKMRAPLKQVKQLPSSLPDSTPMHCKQPIPRPFRHHHQAPLLHGGLPGSRHLSGSSHSFHQHQGLHPSQHHHHHHQNCHYLHHNELRVPAAKRTCLPLAAPHALLHHHPAAQGVFLARMRRKGPST